MSDIEVEVNIEVDGHKRWAIARMGEMVFKERLPLHILALSQDDQIFHMQQIARRLKDKVNKYFKMNRLPARKPDDKASSTSII